MRYIIVSTNNNPDYFAYAKYIEKAWNKLGWELCVLITHDVNPLDLEISNPNTIIVLLPNIPELRIETVAQASRLYAANYLPESAILMTSDMDLLPLSDYWTPLPENITVYGHDLTDYTYYPMGYVAMTGYRWKDVMRITHAGVAADLLSAAKETKIAFSDKWEDWWNFDWDLLTKRLKPLHDKLILITRGRRLTGTYAYGRVDRGDGMKIPPNETLIDAHCENHNVMHPDKWNKFISLFESVYGKL